MPRSRVIGQKGLQPGHSPIGSDRRLLYCDEATSAKQPYRQVTGGNLCAS